MTMYYRAALGVPFPIQRSEHGASPAGDDHPLMAGQPKTKGDPSAGYKYQDPTDSANQINNALSHAVR